MQRKSIRVYVEGKSVPQGSMSAKIKYKTGSRCGTCKRGIADYAFVHHSSGVRLKAWRKSIADAFRDKLGESEDDRMGAGVVVNLDFKFRLRGGKTVTDKYVTTPDVDKLVRAALDGLTGVAFDDDKQVHAVNATKSYAPKGAKQGAWIEVIYDAQEETNIVGNEAD